MMRPGINRRRLVALMVKEVAQISRDPSSYLIAFVLPIVLLILFGYAVSLDASRTRIALVLQDSGTAANSLALDFIRSPYFEVQTERALQSAQEIMASGKARGIVVIPPEFGQRVANGESPPVQIITDGSQPNTANFVASYAQSVIAHWNAAERVDAPGVQVGIEQRVWFNPGLNSRLFLVPGAIAVVMTMIGSLLTALVIAREWERGTMEAVMATPISMTEFVASKVIPYFALGFGSMVACSFFAVLVFGVPLRGSLPTLALVGAAYLLPSLGQGLWISAATKNQFVASQVALFTAFLPTFLLSGFLFEISSMPWPIRLVTHLVPARYFIPPLQSVFMAGDVWSLIVPNVLILLVFGATFFMFAMRATRRSLD